MTTSHNKQLTRYDDHTCIRDWWTNWPSDWQHEQRHAQRTREVSDLQTTQKQKNSPNNRQRYNHHEENKDQEEDDRRGEVSVRFSAPKWKGGTRERGERKGQILTTRRVDKTAWDPEPHPRKKQQWEKQRANETTNGQQRQSTAGPFCKGATPTKATPLSNTSMS